MSRYDDLKLQLKGLVFVRALLEAKGASAVEVDAHTDAIARVRTKLARLEEAGAEGGYR